MSELKATPGPWTMVRGVDGDADAMFINGTGWWGLARVWVRLEFDDDDHPEGIANGHLITAAPDLYAALTMVRDADDDCKLDGLPTIPATARAAINAALAKARGEQ